MNAFSHERAPIAFNALCISSALLLIAVIGLWLRSIWYLDEFEIIDSGQTTSFSTAPGSIGLWQSFGPARPWQVKSIRRYTFAYEKQIVDSSGGISVYHANRFPWRTLGFDCAHMVYAPNPGGFGMLPRSANSLPGFSVYIVSVPFWIIGVLLALPFLPMVKSCRRRKRQKRGLCGECGYDLQATPGRCPECGHLPKQRPDPTTFSSARLPRP